MKKFVPYLLAAAAVTTIAASAQADRRGPDSDVSFAAQSVEADAYSLVQILARTGPANTQLIQNAGMVAKEAHDLVENPFSPREFDEVLNAFDILSQNYRWQRPQGRMVDQAFRRLDYSVQDLEDACRGGGRDGRDGRDDGFDGRDGRDGFDGRDGRDGRDDGFDGRDGQDGGGDWGQNDDGQGDGDWGQRH